jgi:hypothetical protein
MFRFGWLTITADDLAVWQAYPNAAFTLISAAARPPAEGDEHPAGGEFRLGDVRIADRCGGCQNGILGTSQVRVMRDA